MANVDKKKIGSEASRITARLVTKVYEEFPDSKDSKIERIDKAFAKIMKEELYRIEKSPL